MCSTVGEAEHERPTPTADGGRIFYRGSRWADGRHLTCQPCFERRRRAHFSEHRRRVAEWQAKHPEDTREYYPDFWHDERHKVLRECRTFFEHGACPGPNPHPERDPEEPGCHGLLRIKHEKLQRSRDMILECAYCKVEVFAGHQNKGWLGRSVRGDSFRNRWRDNKTGSRERKGIVGYARNFWLPGGRAANIRMPTGNAFWNNGTAHKVIADEIACFPLDGVSFEELRKHLGAYYSAGELKPKWLRGWLKRCIEERLIVCREGRYHRVFASSGKENEE